MIPSSIIEAIEPTLGDKILSISPVGGGDINLSYKLITNKDTFFIKINNGNAFPLMFEKEAKGLSLLAKPCLIKIPKVVAFGKAGGYIFLILEFIEHQANKKDFWKIFGRQLAQLHLQTNEQFGLDHDNYIGSLAQYNKYKNTWSEFYISQRLQPQVKLAIQHRKFSTSILPLFEKLYYKIERICPAEPPALTHGDLWSGNYMINEKGTPVLVDPAVSYAHREMDLAMTRLFGGFNDDFYKSYHEIYPVENGLEKRLDIYQLYYLLVHVNLFGGGYIHSVQSILKRF